MKTFAYGVLPFVVILGVIAGLMLLEPPLSGTVLKMCIRDSNVSMRREGQGKAHYQKAR